MPALGLGRQVDPGAGPARYVFAICAEQDPQVMLRIAGLFAQRNIVPHQTCCRRSGHRLLVDLEVELDNAAAATLLVEKFRSMVMVERASLVEGKC